MGSSVSRVATNLNMRGSLSLRVSCRRNSTGLATRYTAFVPRSGVASKSPLRAVK